MIQIFKKAFLLCLEILDMHDWIPKGKGSYKKYVIDAIEEI